MSGSSHHHGGIPSFTSVADATANGNFKVFGDASAAVALQGAQNLVAHSNRSWINAENFQNAWAHRLITPDVVEAVSAVKMLTGRESMSIAEAIAMGQISMKGAQSTPPVTP